MCPFFIYKHETGHSSSPHTYNILSLGLQQFASALQGERDQTGATELNQDSQSGDKGENEGGEPTSKENKSDKEDQGTA